MSRDPSTIGFSTIRGGDIVGDHTVLLQVPENGLKSRTNPPAAPPMRKGSLRAARFLADKSGGLFDMQDVLHLK